MVAFEISEGTPKLHLYRVALVLLRIRRLLQMLVKVLFKKLLDELYPVLIGKPQEDGLGSFRAYDDVEEVITIEHHATPYNTVATSV